MNDHMNPEGVQTLKINCHDPRSHQHFLQFCNDMLLWQLHTSDSS